ncbi:MAG: hypothetical protein R6W91_08040 [Thermoplasmata archaeon]
MAVAVGSWQGFAFCQLLFANCPLPLPTALCQLLFANCPRRGIGLVNSTISMGAAIGSITAGYLLSGNAVDNTFFLAAGAASAGMLVALMARETLYRKPETENPR